MSCRDQKARFVIKMGQGVPTIPASADHRNGDWIATDIYPGEQYMDTDTGIVYTRNGNEISVVSVQPQSHTYAQVATMASNGTLIPGGFYDISDEGILVQALTNELISPNATRHMRIVKNEYYTPSGSTLGVWNTSLSVSASDNAVWGGRVWINNSGSVGVYVDPENLDSNWDVVDQDNDTYYFDKAFFCLYDFPNNWVSKQWDDRNNVLGSEYSGIFPNYLHICDWGNELILNNQSQYIYNNSNGAAIDNNIVLRGIYYNQNTGDISSNIMNGQIMENSNAGAIQDNVGVLNIAGNSNTGDITKNRNNGAISGIGSANTNITQNINNGDIMTTTTGVINDTVVNK